jgi:uncharacterized surface protein with fasciclin (FAS1) repeats
VTRSHRPFRMLAVAAVLALGAAACSGSEPTETATTEPPEAVPTTDMTTEAMPTEPMATEAPTGMGGMGGTEGASAEGMEDAGGDLDIVTALQDAGLNGLAAVVASTGIADELERLPEFTVFAPSDEALANADIAVESIDPQELNDTLLYHVVDQRLPSSELAAGENTVDTLQGTPLTVTVDGETVTVGDGATVVQPDIEVGDKGVIHVIDQVLQPGA